MNRSLLTGESKRKQLRLVLRFSLSLVLAIALNTGFSLTQKNLAYTRVEQWYGRRHHTKYVPGADLQQYSLPAYQPPSSQPLNQVVPDGLSGSDPDSFRPPDKFVDTAQVDSDGTRHFANGKHFDLSKVSLSQVLADAKNQKGFLDRRSREQFFGSQDRLQSDQRTGSDNFGTYNRRSNLDRQSRSRWYGVDFGMNNQMGGYDRGGGSQFQMNGALLRKKRHRQRLRMQQQLMDRQAAYSAYWQ